MAYDREFWDRWDDDLSECVGRDLERGDCREVRAFFDSHFWSGTMDTGSHHRWMTQVTWEHVKLALKAESKPMLKLLVTWGAQVTDEEMARLRAVAKDKYPQYLKLLRQSGLPLSAEAMKDIPYVEPEAAFLNAGLIPEEWRRVLRVFHDQGAGEAMIAGGALCDLFNGRAINDVDIFLGSRGSEKNNRAFLGDVFNATRLRFTGDCEAPDYYLDEDDLPSPDNSKLSIRHEGNLGTITGEARAESWAVKVKSRETEYKIVFVDNFKFINKDSGHYVPGFFNKEFLMNGFDLGLCQIAYDGKEISRTYAYDNDVKYQQITLRNPNDQSREHLQRIVKKYPDWKLCAESRKLLAPPAKRGFWRTSDSGPR